MSELPLIPAIIQHSGDYTHTIHDDIEWSYSYDITAAGTRGERREGRLITNAIDLARAKPGDRATTPWGTMELTSAPHEKGWLLQREQDASTDAKQGQLFEAPAGALARGGRWTAHVEEWRYTVSASAMGTRSEQRIGQLSHGPTMLAGQKQGDFVETPWGTMRWLGPVNVNEKTDYEQGFLLRGTSDRSLDDLAGDPIVPTENLTCTLESLYLEGVTLAETPLTPHSIVLSLSGRPDRENTLTGTLAFDPNNCQLNVFGDRQACTLIATRVFEVRLTLQRIPDPSGLQRRFFAVSGQDIPETLAFIVQGRLERCYLKQGKQLVPLFMAEGC
jgi:hypothetical protein